MTILHSDQLFCHKNCFDHFFKVQKMQKSLPADLSIDDLTCFENLLKEYYQKNRILKTVIAKYIFRFLFIQSCIHSSFSTSKIYKF